MRTKTKRKKAKPISRKTSVTFLINKDLKVKFQLKAKKNGLTYSDYLSGIIIKDLKSTRAKR